MAFYPLNNNLPSSIEIVHDSGERSFTIDGEFKLAILLVNGSDHVFTTSGGRSSNGIAFNKDLSFYLTMQSNEILTRDGNTYTYNSTMYNDTHITVFVLR